MTDKEKEINDLKKDLNVKNAQINALELQVSKLEKEHHTHKKHQDKRIKDLEISCKQRIRKEKDLVSTPDDSSIQCNKCEYKLGLSCAKLSLASAKLHTSLSLSSDQLKLATN